METEGESPEKGSGWTRTKYPGIFQRGSRFVVKFRGPDGRQRQRSCRTLTEARRIQSALRTDVSRGEYRDVARTRFEDYARAWITGFNGRTGKGVRLATRSDYERVLERYAIPHFNRRRLAEITLTDVRGF